MSEPIRDSTKVEPERHRQQEPAEFDVLAKGVQNAHKHWECWLTVEFERLSRGTLRNVLEYSPVFTGLNGFPELPTSFADLEQAELNEIITEINDQPRKILGWATPTEIFNELCSQQTTPTRCTSN